MSMSIFRHEHSSNPLWRLFRKNIRKCVRIQSISGEHLTSRILGVWEDNNELLVHFDLVATDRPDRDIYVHTDNPAFELNFKEIVSAEPVACPDDTH